MKTKTCKCLNCHQVVTVNIVQYGDGHVGVCPLCNGVAYNRRVKKGVLSKKLKYINYVPKHT